MPRLRSLLTAAAMAIIAPPALAQPVVVADPTPTNAQGQPVSVADTFQHGRDGGIIGPATTLATSQASVATSATQVCPARPGRQRAILSEITAIDFYYGGLGVSALSGAFVKGVAGASVVLDTPAAIYAAGMSAVTITCTELY